MTDVEGFEDVDPVVDLQVELARCQPGHPSWPATHCPRNQPDQAKSRCARAAGTQACARRLKSSVAA